MAKSVFQLIVNGVLLPGAVGFGSWALPGACQLFRHCSACPTALMCLI